MSELLDKRLDPLDSQEQRAAEKVGQALRGDARFVASDGSEFPIPNELADVFQQLAQAAADGLSVRFQVGEPRPLTPRQAAVELGMSRTTVCKLMDAGELQGTYVGTHRRIDWAEVERYRRVRAEQIAARYAERTADLPDAPDEPMPKLAGPAPRRPRA